MHSRIFERSIRHVRRRRFYSGQPGIDARTQAELGGGINSPSHTRPFAKRTTASAILGA